MPPEETTPPGAVTPPATPPAPAAGGATPPPASPPVTPPAAPEVDETKLDPATKAHIEKLRREAAGYRVKAKEATDKLQTVKKSLGIEGDLESPEEKVKNLSQEKLTLSFENAVLASALENGVPKEGLDYFSFLVQREASGLKENEEVSAERLSALALEAKTKAIKTPASSTVTPTPGSGGGATPPAPANGDQLTVEKFAVMTMTEKSKLYETNPTVYEQMFKTALEKKLIK